MDSMDKKSARARAHLHVLKFLAEYKRKINKSAKTHTNNKC